MNSPVSGDLDPVQHPEDKGDCLVSGVRVGGRALQVGGVGEGSVGNILLRTQVCEQQQKEGLSIAHIITYEWHTVVLGCGFLGPRRCKVQDVTSCNRAALLHALQVGMLQVHNSHFKGLHWQLHCRNGPSGCWLPGNFVSQADRSPARAYLEHAQDGEAAHGVAVVIGICCDVPADTTETCSNQQRQQHKTLVDNSELPCLRVFQDSSGRPRPQAR